MCIRWDSSSDCVTTVGELMHKYGDTTHHLRSPWWQRWSSALDCRGRWSLWGSSCTRRPPDPCTACDSSCRSLKVKGTHRVTTGTAELDVNKPTSRFSFERHLFCKYNSRTGASSSKQMFLDPLKNGGGGNLRADYLFFPPLCCRVQFALWNWEKPHVTSPALHHRVHSCFWTRHMAKIAVYDNYLCICSLAW